MLINAGVVGRDERKGMRKENSGNPLHVPSKWDVNLLQHDRIHDGHVICEKLSIACALFHGRLNGLVYSRCWSATSYVHFVRSPRWWTVSVRDNNVICKLRPLCNVTYTKGHVKRLRKRREKLNQVWTHRFQSRRTNKM